MLSTLLVASAAVASAASLDRRFEFTTEEGISGVTNHKLNDACHPAWNFDTCNTDKLQPPCPAELGLLKRCEESTKGSQATATEEQRKAYRDCLFGEGSAYPAVQRGCVECKVANGWFTAKGGEYLNGIFEKGNKDFENNVKIAGSPWSVFGKRINWEMVNAKNRDENATRVEMEEYWTKPVRDLKIGRYTLNGTTYGGDLDCNKGKTEACSSDDMDEQVTEPAAVPESPVEAQDPIGHFELEIVSIQGEEKTATVYKTSKGVINFERTFTFWQYVSIKEKGVLDADRNQDIMSLVDDGKCDACPVVASVEDIIAAGPSTPTSDDKAAKLLMQNLPSNVTGAGPIDDAVKTKRMTLVIQT